MTLGARKVADARKACQKWTSEGAGMTLGAQKVAEARKACQKWTSEGAGNLRDARNEPLRVQD